MWHLQFYRAILSRNFIARQNRKCDMACRTLQLCRINKNWPISVHRIFTTKLLRIERCSNRKRSCRGDIGLKTRSSAIAERPARRSASVEMLSYCYTNNAHISPVSAWGALSATATFYSATYMVLYSHRCSRYNCRPASMRCCRCYQQTFIQPTLLTSTVATRSQGLLDHYHSYRPQLTG